MLSSPVLLAGCGFGVSFCLCMCFFSVSIFLVLCALVLVKFQFGCIKIVSVTVFFLMKNVLKHGNEKKEANKLTGA